MLQKLGSGRRSCQSQAWEDMSCGLWCRRVRRASRAGGALKAGGHLPGMARQAGGWPAVPHDGGLSWFRTGFHSAREPSAWCPHYMDGSLRAPLSPQQEKCPGLRGASGLGESRLCPQRAVGEGSGHGKPAGTTPAPQHCRSLVFHWSVCHRVPHLASAAISPGFIREDASAPETRLPTSA